MSRKLIAALMALAAFAAFAMSATAASATTLTQPTGTPLATGSTIVGTNVGNTIMTSSTGSVLIECSKATMSGTLNSNSGTVSGTINTATFEGTSTESRCTGSGGIAVKVTTGIAGGLPYCVKNTKEDNFEIRGGTCAEAARSIKYTMDFNGTAGTCGYEVASLTGTFTTDTTGDAVMILSHAGTFKRFEQAGIVGILCPETSFLDMTFTLESSGSTAYFS